MDLRKYSVSEFSEMLENEMKLNKEKCEKIAKYYEMKRDIKNDLEITYKIVAPVEKNVYYRRPLEMAYNYPMRRKTPCFSYGDIRRVHRIYASN
jgi:hypothetical protein